MKSSIFKLSTKISITLLGVFFVFICPNVQASAITGFNPGKIIDDAVFTNFQSMNVSQIQNFLNSKMPTCDTWGTVEYRDSGITRAQFVANTGNPAPPYTCLKDYSQDGKSSAQIIYDTSQEFHINPQVILVLLQKEQSLITDDWPWPDQYKSATGYGCPDTAPCDSKYFGLTNQIRNAAEDFRMAIDNSPDYYSSFVIGNNFVQYAPDPGCGGTIVNIQNQATRALYTYTPYQPNQASLNAGYGEGDYCSSYGNRNFYLLFTDWFGSTLGVNRIVNSELKNIAISKNSIGNYIYGSAVIVEWVNGVSTVPSVKPVMKFRSTDGTVIKELFVIPNGTNTYYFDGFIDGINTNKEYYIEISSGDPNNISINKSMYIRTANSNILGRTSNNALVQYISDNGILRLQIKNN